MTDTQALLHKLKAISDENRFHLLNKLHKPKTINQIGLTAENETQEYRKDRCLTRQGIQYHLDILREAGLITATFENRDGRRMNVHQIDPCGVYTFLDDLSQHLGKLAADAPPVKRSTIRQPVDELRSWPSEPRLVVVRGLDAGRAFSLAGKPPHAERGWIVGRSPQAEIALPYDPYVAAEQGEILPEDDRFLMLDLRSSENRTFLNDQTIGRGEEVGLHRGDVIRVGRSELLYQGP